MSAIKEIRDFVAVWVALYLVAYCLGSIVTAIGG